MNIQSLTSEYYMLRAKLVCLQGRSDIAEYLYAQVPPPGSINNLNQAVVSQLCHEIGCNASEAYEHELAIKWLKRAAEWIDRSQVVYELTVLAHFYIKFSESLGTTVVLQAFDLFLLHLPINQRDWIDQSFVFFTTTVIHLDISEEMRIATVDKAAHALNKRGFDGLSEPGTHAVFAVVWKHIDGLGDEYYSTTQQWCKLLLNNEILQTSSEFNKIQIQKKFVECALETKQENDPYFASSMRYDEEGDTIVYSPTELAYLATTSFNRAMDFYSEEKDIECKHWVEESIRLAKLMGNAEGDGLVLLFKNKLEGLF
ncbi:hypothetical protein N7478_006627 [Penicillium angulare]|uniref:uncharacterized protein n=1 Tax=Penicillium angulare TaxID=116970 RepID=UPI002541005C|nr:uncharacterized protein N7478_006627 [Penicillium angulare]KAJ5281255.1 hypothetical protein N7478_006627 [Penicillium angulare]